jgi:hypothetical protein
MPGLSSLFQKSRYLQGEIILPTARTIYLAIACVSLAGAVCALLVAVAFEVQSGRSAPQVSVPAPYTAQVQPMNLDLVRARLLPPTNIAFVASQPVFGSAISGDTVLGYFTAETPNGLASFPNDISILGGPDAGLFDPVGSNYPGPATRTALRPGPQLIEEIDTELATLSAPKARRFSLVVIARDSYGNASRPATVTFNIMYGPVSAAAAPAERLTELQRLARDIALTLDPTRIPPNYYMGLYQRALREPGACSTGDNNYVFVSQYRQAFEQLRTNLNAQNIGAFYDGVCAAWRQAILDAESAEQNANAARASAIAQNEEAKVATELTNFAARSTRNVALAIAGSALLAFITISLFLAFLAMENHSKAMREAVEILAGTRRDGRDGLPGGPVS